PSAEKFDSHPASTKSGSVASTTSADGARSASTGTSPASSARCSGSGPSENAVPTRRSARPRESTSSVEVDLMVTIRSGGASTVTSVPQLSTVTGYADGPSPAEAPEEVTSSSSGEDAPSAVEQAVRASAASTARANGARRGTSRSPAHQEAVMRCRTLRPDPAGRARGTSAPGCPYGPVYSQPRVRSR